MITNFIDEKMKEFDERLETRNDISAKSKLFLKFEFRSALENQARKFVEDIQDQIRKSLNTVDFTDGLEHAQDRITSLSGIK